MKNTFLLPGIPNSTNAALLSVIILSFSLLLLPTGQILCASIAARPRNLRENYIGDDGLVAAHRTIHSTKNGDKYSSSSSSYLWPFGSSSRRSSSDRRPSNLNWLSLSWLRSVDPFEYPIPKPEDLEAISGFEFCSNLNGAIFDVSAPLKSRIVSVYLDELSALSPQYDEASLLFQYVLNRKMARVFSPTLDMERLERGDFDSYRSTTIADMGTADFVHFIDFVAEFLYRAVTSRYILATIERNELHDRFITAAVDGESSAKRFACFMAADGYNDWVQLTLNRRKLLRFVDGKTYYEGAVDFSPLNMTTAFAEAKRSAERSAGHVKTSSTTSKPSSSDRDQENSKSFSKQNAILSQKRKDEAANLKRFLNTFSRNPTARMMEESRPYLPRIKRESVRPHKMAYLLMVHSKYETVINLLDAIFDPFVTIIIHVDAKNPKLKVKLQNYVTAHQRRFGYHNIKVMEKSFKCRWGYSTLVYAQMAGYFELMNMKTDWEYVVNLSGFDYPLKTNDVIYEDLKKYGTVNFIDYWVTLEAVTRVHDLPLLASADSFAGNPTDINSTVDNNFEIQGIRFTDPKVKALKETLQTQNIGHISFPFSHWKLYKHSQWMILTRPYIEFLRDSPTAIYVSAFMEWSLVPDEAYFASVGLNLPEYELEFVNDNKRYLEFPFGYAHPRTILPEDLPLLMNQAEEGVAYTRKINMDRPNSWYLIYGIEKIRSWNHRNSTWQSSSN